MPNLRTTVVNLFENMPAITSGIQLGDCIVKVENEDVSDKNYNYVSSKIKGKPATSVNITVKRNDDILNYTLQRVKNKIDWFQFLR